MKTLFPSLIVLGFLMCGCSGDHFKALKFIEQANDLYEKAIKNEKQPFEQKTALLEQACDSYYQAYLAKKEFFDFFMFDKASFACGIANDQEKENFFKAAAEDYKKKYPGSGKIWAPHYRLRP